MEDSGSRSLWERVQFEHCKQKKTTCAKSKGQFLRGGGLRLRGLLAPLVFTLSRRREASVSPPLARNLTHRVELYFFHSLQFNANSPVRVGSQSRHRTSKHTSWQCSPKASGCRNAAWRSTLACRLCRFHGYVNPSQSDDPQNCVYS